METKENKKEESLTKKEWSKPLLTKLDQNSTEMDNGPHTDASGVTSAS